MNWGDIQIESLKKMFLNNESLDVDDLETYLEDKKYKTYLFAMPQACNEAINYIASRLGTQVEKYTLEHSDENTFDLSDNIPDMRKIKKIVCPEGVSYKVLSPTVIQFDDWYLGNVDIYYEVAVDVIRESTPITKRISSLKDEYAKIIPLYIAGELYKDDDLSMSTMYMNEFFNMINVFAEEDLFINNPIIQTIYRVGD